MSDFPGLVLRGIAPPLHLRDHRLVAFDMDSTLIDIECVDEIADAAGRKAEVAAITEAAMRGEISDYKDSLRRRVALLRGVPAAALDAVYRERLHLNPGVEVFVQACRAAGLKTLLVSGGFTHFSERVRQRPHVPADAEALARCEPVIQEFPGWETLTDKITRWEDLPVNCRHYLLTLAQLTGARLTIVSVGPAREQPMFL